QKSLTLLRPARSLATPAHKSTDTGHNMLLVGLTGNIASGKTTVAQLLSERGATIIDADVLARRAVERGTSAFDATVHRWGRSVLAPDGHLDRGALRRAVFGNAKEREALDEHVAA